MLSALGFTTAATSGKYHHIAFSNLTKTSNMKEKGVEGRPRGGGGGEGERGCCLAQRN